MDQRAFPLPPSGGFFARRWNRAVPLGTLFWRDMFIVATLINLVAAFASLMALGFKAPTVVAMLFFLAPLPYNFFLVAAIWRTADLVDPKLAASSRMGALVWLVIATVI